MLGAVRLDPQVFSRLMNRRRRIEVETRLTQLHTQDAKEREIRKYSKTESQHLRLRRTKIKLTDFRTVKVIGKGAFGEVSELPCLTTKLTSESTS